MAGRKTDAPIPEDCPLELACSRCKRTRPREMFPRNRSTRTTFAYTCIDCERDLTAETRFRKEIQGDGVDAFRQQIARDIAMVRMRLRILREHRMEQEAIRLATTGNPIPPELKARIGKGSRRRIKQAAIEQIESRLRDELTD